MIKEKLIINNNDTYILTVTKDFVVINNAYNGLLVYDKELNFIKKIKLSEDFVVYQLFSSSLNNWIIVQDVENEVLYSIETSIEKVIQIYFKDIFYHYYFCEQNRAILKTSQNTYTFDFDILESIVENQNNNFYRNMLINNQTSSL